VRRLWGVVGVTNNIKVKARVNTFNLTSDIIRALHRSWLDPKGVKVTTDGGRVTLTGYVDSWNDRALAGSTAWAAPGATDVENHLIIS
jgi:osmotically-inducible protein OsmY